MATLKLPEDSSNRSQLIDILVRYVDHSRVCDVCAEPSKKSQIALPHIVLQCETGKAILDELLTISDLEIN